MACGTPVVVAADKAMREIAGDAAVYADDGDFTGALRHALDERSRLSEAGIVRARLFSWQETVLGKDRCAVYRRRAQRR